MSNSAFLQSVDLATNLPLTDGDRRLIDLMTNALGSKHPAMNDLMKLVFDARGRAADAASDRDVLADVEVSALVHDPLKPPRSGFLGECVFALAWKTAMGAPMQRTWNGDDQWPIDRVLRNCGHRTTQRDASIVASMACWLGTNCGQSILHEAQHALAGAGHKRYVMALASENTRVVGVNHFGRTIEAFTGSDVNLAFTARDLEAIDSMMLWLAGEEGQTFLAETELQLKRLRDEQSQAAMAAWRAKRDQAYGAPGAA
jgi:hypothetical protein